MSISKRPSHSGKLPSSHVSWRAFRLLLKAAAMSIAMLSGSALADFCESDIALIDSNFSGGNLGVCELSMAMRAIGQR